MKKYTPKLEEAAKIVFENDELTELLQSATDKKYLKFNLIGYTMGFNDGEPCYHSQYIRTDLDDIDEDDDETYTEDGFLVSDDLKTWAGITNEKLVQYFESCEDLIERIYGTDWKLTLTYDVATGKLALKDKADYDCGY